MRNIDYSRQGRFWYLHPFWMDCNLNLKILWLTLNGLYVFFSIKFFSQSFSQPIKTLSLHWGLSGGAETLSWNVSSNICTEGFLNILQTVSRLGPICSSCYCWQDDGCTVVPPAVPSQTNHRILAENPRQHSRKCSLDLIRLSHVGGEEVVEPLLVFCCFNLLTFDHRWTLLWRSPSFMDASALHYTSLWLHI